MYKKESTLGLVGSILGIVAIVLILIFRVIIGGAGAAAIGSQYMYEFGDEMSQLSEEFNAEFGEEFGEFDDAYGEYMDGYDALVVAAAIGRIVTGIIAMLMLIAGVILGFIGKGKLQREDKKGGVLLIVAGGLAFVAMFMGGWVAFVFVAAMAALCLTGGIMAVAKRTPVPPMAPPPIAPIQ